jgi:hypothetical protein
MYAIAKMLINLIVVLFFVGMAGSAVVVLIAFVDDCRELFGSDDDSSELEKPIPFPAAKSAPHSYPSQGKTLRHS